ncbi:MAG: TIGR02117 family protein [Planctomycetota bacterium]
MAAVIKILLMGWAAARRGVKAVGVLLAVYAAYLVIGLWPTNRDYTPPAGGVVVYVTSSPVHTDIVVPLTHDAWDWREWFSDEDFTAEQIRATHIAIGWGDRGFYLDTPTWADLKVSTALRAMFLPSGSVMHVWRVNDPAGADGFVQVKLDREQYRRLCESMTHSLALDTNGRPQPLAGEAYSSYDAFYQAVGSYHCFNTCNSWAGRRLKQAGAPAPLFTPLPHQPGMYLPGND